ncbi:MAG: hypothetical protein HY907_02790 [Deltaproteobacteria bacterium]|nr:hypothetical protein [Deltaproteobacteria bacterium]
MTKPVVVALEMGYGHLRAAAPLAEALGTELLHADRPPLADEAERRRWARTRTAYERISRASQVPFAGAPLRALLDTMTAIPPLYPFRDLSAPTYATYALDRMITSGRLGRTLAEHLRKTGAPLLTTFYSTAVAADRLGISPVWCVVTDTDINRIWVPVDPRASRIVYLTPAYRVDRRLRSYGVPAERIRFTGFPLPPALLGGPELPTLRRNLAARLVRLDPSGSFRRRAAPEIARVLGSLPDSEEGRAPLIVFAVGGAGAQSELPRSFLPEFKQPVLEGRVRLTLVAGVRAEVEAGFRECLRDTGLDGAVGSGIEIVREPTMEAYLRRMDGVLAEADVLWTKPSEMVFYAALGLPLVLSWPVGVHERYNRRWVEEHGAGLRQRDPRSVAAHLAEWLSDGTLAAAAWSGFTRLPHSGLYGILEAVGA